MITPAVRLIIKPMCQKYNYVFSLLFSTSSSFSTKYHKPQSYNQQQLTVQSIINNQTKTPLFVYKQSREVCNTIKQLFNNISQNPTQTINQLYKLFTHIHLSSFSSWKMLNQTSHTINYALNQTLSQSNKKLTQKDFLSLLQVLYSLNYHLDEQNDKRFIQSIVTEIYFGNNLLKAVDLLNMELKTFQVLSKHPALFIRLFCENKKNIQQTLLNKIINSAGNESINQQRLLTKLIKNGLYQSYWDGRFLQHIRNVIQSQQTIKDRFTNLLNALKMHGVKNQNSQQQNMKDQWTTKSQTTSNNSPTNIVTEQKILNILKQLDYPVQINQCIFDYQIDYKLSETVIVQYHGIHHYKINTKSPIQTMKSNWKMQCLKKKGYKLFVIPFYQWNQLQTIFDKKRWLINNMEHCLFSK